jgi:hypothetical protein
VTVRFFKQFDGLGRDSLERVAAEAIQRVRRLTEHLERAEATNRQLFDNLTHVQTRCTELLLENRRLRAEAALPGFICTACGNFTGLAKEDHQTCRCCGAARPA